MANGRLKKRVSRGGKKVTTKKITNDSSSKKTVVKSPRKTSLKSYSSSYKEGVTKFDDKTYKSASSMGGTRKSSSSSKFTATNKGNRDSASGVNTKTSKVKNPRKTQVKSSTYGFSRSGTYDKYGTPTSGTNSYLEKEKKYKSTAGGAVKASGRASRYGESSTPNKNIGTSKTYKYKKTPSGSTKLRQSSSTFNEKGYTTNVKKYKNGNLAKSKTRSKVYKKR